MILSSQPRSRPPQLHGGQSVITGEAVAACGVGGVGVLEGLKQYLRAGEIAARVREEAAQRLEPGTPVLEFCEWVETRIRELGGAPAFPCNISINEVAAHYTPVIGDELRVPEDAVVKIDLGVHVEGYIADTAVTVDLGGKWQPLLEAVREALERALQTVKPGARFAETGKVIAETIEKYGFRPIVNLGGHSLGRYRIHAGESIPNMYDPSVRGRYRAGAAYAIEPFGTNGEGLVYEGDQVTIYALVRPSLRRRLEPIGRRLIRVINERFRTLPFTERWLSDVVSDVEVLRKWLRRLSKMGFLVSYPVLIERGGGVVAQFEHTLVLTEEGDVIVTTAPKG